MLDTHPMVADDRLSLPLPDGTAPDLPLIWLRHNCPSAFHPVTGERAIALTDIPARPRVAEARVDDAALTLTWADGHVSHFDLDWLMTHAPGRRRPDPATQIGRVPWRAEKGIAGPARFDARRILSDDGALYDWMAETRRSGLTLVGNAGDTPEGGMAVAQRIAFLRETNFGRTFEVMSKPDPINLAYTAEALPMHTDLPNQELAPGFQFLHCIANEAEGGGSVFVDGLAVAEDLRAEDPEAFEALSEIPVPSRYFDKDTDLRNREPVLTLDHDGAVVEIRYSAHLIDMPDMPADTVIRWYAAARAFAERIDDPAYRITLKLKGGEIAVFDNRRILHGREAFDPSTGFRHLHGCYVDRGEFDSRLRVLGRTR